MPPLAIPRAERPDRVNTFCKKWAPLFVVDTPDTGAIPVSKNPRSRRRTAAIRRCRRASDVIGESAIRAGGAPVRQDSRPARAMPRPRSGVVIVLVCTASTRARARRLRWSAPRVAAVRGFRRRSRSGAPLVRHRGRSVSLAPAQKLPRRLASTCSRSRSTACLLTSYGQVANADVSWIGCATVPSGLK